MKTLYCGLDRLSISKLPSKGIDVGTNFDVLEFRSRRAEADTGSKILRLGQLLTCSSHLDFGIR